MVEGAFEELVNVAGKRFEDWEGGVDGVGGFAFWRPFLQGPVILLADCASILGRIRWFS